jgi:hypothetical protein
MAELARITGLEVGEINSAIGRMRAAGEVEAIGEPGSYLYRWRFNV